MVEEITSQDTAPRSDAREAYQERVTGTTDLDGAGASTVTVSLSGDMSALGLGIFGAVTADDGTAALESVTADSVDVAITGGTADATSVGYELVVTEDPWGTHG